MQQKKITSALISAFDKNGLEPIIKELVDNGVSLYSTGGTETFIKNLGYQVNSVEGLTGYPSILGGRVKTLHPKVFGGILNRSEISSDQNELKTYEIPAFDLVIVDLYPFEKTIASKASESEIIEKIENFGQETLITGPRTALESLEIKNNLFYGFGDTRRPDSSAKGP